MDNFFVSICKIASDAAIKKYKRLDPFFKQILNLSFKDPKATCIFADAKVVELSGAQQILPQQVPAAKIPSWCLNRKARRMGDPALGEGLRLP